MKRTFFLLSIVTLFASSCKKEQNPAEFTPTDKTGKAHIKGYLSKNVIAPNGTGGWNSNARIPAANVKVSVRIAKSALYPNSNAQGSDIYNGVSDVKGNYDIEVTATGSGVTANVMVEGFYATFDTIVNGVAKTGLPCLYAGNNANVTVWTGQNSVYNYNFNASTLTDNPNNISIGSAQITGSVGMNFIRCQVNGTNTPIYASTIVPVSNKQIYLDLDMDPILLSTRQYTATTDGSGKFTFNIATVAAGTPGFAQNATIWAPDLYTSRDTVFVVNGNTISPFTTGKFGVFNSVQTVENAVYNTEIRNAVNLIYNSFQPN